MLKAKLVLLQIIEHHADDANNFFLVKIVENLGNVLDNIKLKVCEVNESEVMSSQNPKRAAYIISDLTVLNAFSLQHSVEDIHALGVNKLFGQLIGLEHEHKAVSESFS